MPTYISVVFGKWSSASGSHDKRLLLRPSISSVLKRPSSAGSDESLFSAKDSSASAQSNPISRGRATSSFFRSCAERSGGHHKWRTQRGTLKRFKAVRFEIAGATLDKKLSLSDKSVRRVNRSTHDGISAKALRLSCSDVKAVSCTRLSDTLEQKRAVCCRQRRQPGALAAQELRTDKEVSSTDT